MPCIALRRDHVIVDARRLLIDSGNVVDDQA
jgi:hypothetical protein